MAHKKYSKHMGKKGFVDFTPRKIASYILGIVLLILGIVPLLNSLKLISFTLPPIPEFILWTVAMVGSVVLLVDAYHEIHEFGTFHKVVMIATFITAIVIFIYGINAFIALPFALPPVTGIILDVLLAIGGILLFIGGFMGI